MKLLWLAHEGNLSGANICLLEYLQILKEMGVQNHLVCPHDGGAMAIKAKALGIPVDCIKHYSWARPLAALKDKLSSVLRQRFRNYIAVKQISKLIKQLEPDYVVTNTIASPVAAMAARAMCRKHVWFVHEFGEEDHGFTIAGGFEKGAVIMDSLSYKIVFNSKAVGAKYDSFVPVSKRCYVDNAVSVKGIETPVAANLETFKLILSGQLAPSKNHLEALQAIKICSSMGLNISLSITGRAESSEYRQNLSAFIQREGLSGRVHFTGAFSAPEVILSQHHALLMCSRREAFGRVTVEALKCGLPVIAANTGGSLEIIEEGVNGYFYSAGDANNLAEKIQLLYKNYQLFNRAAIMQQAGLKYNATNTAGQLMKVFS